MRAIRISVVLVGARGEPPPPAQTFVTDRVDIGRLPGRVHVHLGSDQVSRTHARVVVEDDTLVFIDDMSASGSSVNGRHGWGRFAITPDSDVRVGPYRLTITFTERPASEP